MTLHDLTTKYKSVDAAAGAVAIGLVHVTAEDFMWWPESFRTVVLFKQLQVITRLSAVACGTTLEGVQRSGLYNG